MDNNPYDWPKEGLAAAYDLAMVWTEEFDRCLARGDDHAWAAMSADRKRDRFIKCAERAAAKSAVCR